MLLFVGSLVGEVCAKHSYAPKGLLAQALGSLVRGCWLSLPWRIPLVSRTPGSQYKRDYGVSGELQPHLKQGSTGLCSEFPGLRARFFGSFRMRASSAATVREGCGAASRERDTSFFLQLAGRCCPPVLAAFTMGILVPGLLETSQPAPQTKSCWP